MHDSARRYVASVAPYAAVVCEIGSRNINGSVRYLFSGRYVGVDALPGPGVDIVADGATWDGEGQIFDVVICTEVLEHAADAEALVANLVRLCRTGGGIIITAASPERQPHSGIDGGPLRPGEHYAGVTADSLRSWLGNCQKVIIDESVPGDIYCLAVR